MVLVPVAALAIFYVYPLSTVLWLSVTEPRPGLANYARLIENPAIQRILWNTLRLALLATVLAVAAGYLLAYAMVHARGRAARWMMAGLLASFWMSVLVRAFAWLTLLQSRGVVNSALMGAGVIDTPLALMRNETGVLIGMVHYMIPYAALPIWSHMQGMDRRLPLAARGLGASRAAAFARVFLPLSIPGLAAGAVLCFVFALGFYITPALLGGGRVVMVAEYIGVQITETLNWGLGTMLATTLLVAVLLILATLGRLVGLRRLFGQA